MANEIDVSAVIDRLLPDLNADVMADLAFWTETDLYKYADEGVQRIARACGVYVDRTTATMVSGTAEYATPARHLSTLQIDINGSALRPASVRDLEALEDTWEASTGTPTRFVQDYQGTAKVRLWKKPTAGGTLAWIYQQLPPDVTKAADTLDGSGPMEDVITFSVIAAARSRECDGSMPEVAAHCEERLAQFEQIFTHLWGGAR